MDKVTADVDERLAAAAHSHSYCSLFPAAVETLSGTVVRKCAKGAISKVLQCLRPMCEHVCAGEELTCTEAGSSTATRVEQCVYQSIEAVVERQVGRDNVEEYSALLCEEGYGGPLCGVCVAGQDGAPKYGLQKPFDCRRCGGLSWLWVVLGSILAVFAVLTSAALNLYNNKQGFRDVYYTSDVLKVRRVLLWEVCGQCDCTWCACRRWGYSSSVCGLCRCGPLCVGVLGGCI